METVVVQAHPLLESYNAALLDRVRAGLSTLGAGSEVFRLGEGERPTAADVTTARQLVLVYPTWWAGQPAMLLDWLQEMLAAKAFGSVMHLQAITSLGSARWLNKVQGEWGRRFLAERVLGACAADAKFGWHALYKIDRRTPEEIAAFLNSTQELLETAPLPAS